MFEKIPFISNTDVGAELQTLVLEEVQLYQFSRLNAAPWNVTCTLPGSSSGHVLQQLVSVNCASGMAAGALINYVIFQYTFLFLLKIPPR